LFSDLKCLVAVLASFVIAGSFYTGVLPGSCRCNPVVVVGFVQTITAEMIAGRLGVAMAQSLWGPLSS
jgi:hypothetical protein